ncbi:MAG: hypothetical protein V4451_05820 [Pseudomonadota bacterium]
MLVYRKGWIERRAAALMRAFGIDQATAIKEATHDWVTFGRSWP